MSKNLKGLTCLSAIVAASMPNVALAEGELSHNLGFVSQYLWRGFNLNDEKAAIQASVDYENESGFYAGVWASQYDFGDGDDGIEVDLYAGYSMDISDEFWLDFSVTSYQYSGESDASLEWKIGLGHEFFAINYHHDQDLDTNYLELNTQYPLSDQMSLNGHVGRNDDGEENTYDYAVYLSYALSDRLELSGGYSDHEYDEKGAEGTFYVSLFASF
ncbi:TorF family putative porin [Paraglaciecola aestuariivivens]